MSKTLPVGAIVIRSHHRGYRRRLIKVRMDGPPEQRFMVYARWWWEQHRGPIPKGKIVLHLDGNHLNDAPDNLALGTPADNAAIWHFANPDASRAAYVRAATATAATNRLRARIARIAHWLPTRWYPVDHANRLIYNEPRKHRWMIYEAFGIDVEAVGWRAVRPAALGFPSRGLLQACVLAVLCDAGPMDSKAVQAAVRALRSRHGWSDFTVGAFYSSISKLGADRLVRSVKRGSRAAMLDITPEARDMRMRPCPVVPVRGSCLGDEPYCKFEKVHALEDAGKIAPRRIGRNRATRSIVRAIAG